MTEYGLLVHNCQIVMITNCSYFRSVKCHSMKYGGAGGAVGIRYKGSSYSVQQYS